MRIAHYDIYQGVRKAKTRLAIALSTSGLLLGGGGLSLVLNGAAHAESFNIDFESYNTAASINGQDGWVFTGPYDAAFDSSGGTTGFGSQSLRISNASTSGSFGDWVFSKSLTNEAGETAAQNGGLSGGSRQPHFEASWDFASATPEAEQSGLQVSTAPDRGDGARMSFVKMYDTPTGLAIDFADYQSGVNEVGCTLGTNFITTTIATALDRTIPHNIKVSMNFIDGVNNDVVKVYVDGVLTHTGTSWEGYFNECESNPTRTVDSMIFQARSGGGTAPGTLGSGFLIDNLSLLSGPIPPVLVGPPSTKDACKKDGWKTFNNPSFKNQGDCVSYVATGGRNPGSGN